MEMAHMESADKTKAERMIAFCSTVGQDCYALFLFFGRQSDRREHLVACSATTFTPLLISVFWLQSWPGSSPCACWFSF
ncbi:hypothetical protein SKAU_G00316280 [Synaphobranchus kaupii]|uniref:Uncharacterized protein n=1 Tax=Synaphobranchus kaupii TaxID=118154 RepID=A0A9Q1ESR0_SYNKA|nr:hypothetical protein SKAU_G00316280 [Synaphobranchus kaupii]